MDRTKKPLSDMPVVRVKCLNFSLRINLFAITNTAYYSWTNLGFDRSDFNIYFAGRGGLTLPRLLLPAVTDTITHLRPSIVLIQIGENEIDNPACDSISSKLAHDIVSFAQWLIEGFSVRQVAVLQQFQCRRTRHVAVKLFNACVDQGKR